MLTLTRIFNFETAHAIYEYGGACRNIHGHSYELHVSVTGAADTGNSYIPSQGIILDFKELKQIVNSAVINNFDHRLLLSAAFVKDNAYLLAGENLFIMEAEPTAENLLIHIRKALEQALPGKVKLAALKLMETKNSYAEWINIDLWQPQGNKG